MRLAASFLLLFIPAVVQAQDKDSLRIVKPCVAIDGENPLPISLAREIVNAVSSEFEENVGIVFENTEFVLHDGDLSRNNFDHIIYLIRICPPYFDFAIVLSGRPMLVRIIRNFEGNVEDAYYRAGESESHYGVAIVYNVWDKPNSSFPIKVLKHELGHVFGLPHQSTYKESFMYTLVDESLGLWTPDVVEAILKNKNRKWPLSR